ncbi:hypothetical protein PC110_g1011 [Phytophthora cactorum]|uniref:Uncharacterized protein n=1 Tax=Phytophthora cactorum TaxID=29920 RepID=A0A329T3R6_9STRA|nr:hypothetical protein PC112_g2178 [Phytophthora cactorum]KAG2940656.1 hypothetical protein PC115_g2440 [Phytophthora cactorum]KAG3006777.1 hypothetical protein PC120_g17155 [Phytophthora cactorum]KAG3184133.1 hypothetical protein C6341_g5123 [Phytophthora cactorum]RAW42806.1 hypothetical protein PC110_g1011 [Phytophthora cactorum]
MAVLNVKDLGVMSTLLGVTYNEEDGYMIEHRQTIQELLDRFGLAEANSVRVPISDDKDEMLRFIVDREVHETGYRFAVHH